MLSECPVRLIDKDSYDLVLRWYPLYRRGSYPLAGGLLDQAGYYVDVMQYLDEII